MYRPLPDPLTFLDGTPVTLAAQWPRRRVEIRELFEEHVYGRTPTTRIEVGHEHLGTDDRALDGAATRDDVRLVFGGAEGERRHLDLMVHLPNAAAGPVPVLLGLNFQGNAAVLGAGPDTDRQGNWPLAEMMRRGYGVATAWYEDITPDSDDFGRGIHPLFSPGGRRERGPDEWGAIGAWAWGLSRALDHLLADERVDRRRVVVFGHSRLGKTALWAAAQDERFAMAVSNNSGCAGVALSRRRVGETVEAITGRFPYWFCPTFARYARREDELPVDQHLLVALVAPRPVYVASAEDDTWADPEGEFLGALHASPVYDLLGYEGLVARQPPAVNTPVTSRIGYHIRPGGHGMTAYDWNLLADAADRHLRGDTPVPERAAR